MTKKTKHQKRLQHIHNKKTERRILFQPPQNSFWDILKTYQMEFLVGIVIVCIIIFIPRWTSSLTKKNVNPSESSISEEMKQDLMNKYPNGFKLFEIRQFDVKSLDDTLSSEFKVDWGRTQLVQFAGGKIKIKLPTISHGPTGKILKNLIVEFERNHRQIIHMNQMTGMELLAEIISDDGEKVVCLFSLEVK